MRNRAETEGKTTTVTYDNMTEEDIKEEQRDKLSPFGLEESPRLSPQGSKLLLIVLQESGLQTAHHWAAALPLLTVVYVSVL
jgi:tricorn protease-like protein